MTAADEAGPVVRVRVRRSLLLADLLTVLWVAGWIFVAVRIAFDVRSLGHLPGTLRSAGRAVETTGSGLSALGHLPFIGRSLAGIGHRVSRTGRSTELTAASTGNSIDQLSVLLPVVVGLLPLVPVLAVYLPFRVQRLRESRSVMQVLRQSEAGNLRRFLAHRAVTTLSFHRLEAVTGDPWADLEAERYDALAEAELDRLGLHAKSLRPTP